jgi:hypothetical protein
MRGARRWRAAWAALVVALLLVLAACQPVSMQLPANTAVGTGTQANEWASAILNQLGAPTDAAGIYSMIAWFAAEDDGHGAGEHTYGAGENNPLNLTAVSGTFDGTTGSEPSGAGPDHPGNLDFATPAQGVAATVQVIRDKYPAIARALTSDRGLLDNPAVAGALGEWSGGGYSALSKPLR